jgi:cytochrome P450
MEGRSCIGEIVRRYPRLRRGAAEADWIDALIMRGLTRLPVRL